MWTSNRDVKQCVLGLGEEIEDLHRDVNALVRELEGFRMILSEDRAETLAWTKSVMDRYVELSMVRGGDNMGATQHRRVLGTYPEAEQPKGDPEPEEDDDTDWAPPGSDIGHWR